MIIHLEPLSLSSVTVLVFIRSDAYGLYDMLYGLCIHCLLYLISKLVCGERILNIYNVIKIKAVL